MTLASLTAFINLHGWDKNYWIAYSGGLDSHVLLHTACVLRDSSAANNQVLKLKAIHINHGLSKRSNEWARHCAAVCEAYVLPLHARDIKLHLDKGVSLEEVAREKRYAALAEQLTENDILLTAHHQDDQAETLLLQLLRGAGLKGLAAMPSAKRLGRGLHGRPFLSLPRSQLELYAKNNQLKWIEDESNQDCNLTRNFLRAQVLPLLKTRWPTVAKTLSRSANHAKEAQSLLDEFAGSMLTNLAGSQAGTLSIQKLKAFTVEKQKMLLRAWIRREGFPVPDSKKLGVLLKTILHCQPDKMPHMSWSKAEIRRYRDDLFIMAIQAPHDHQLKISWTLPAPLLIEPLGQLHAHCRMNGGLALHYQSIDIGFRQGGEVVSLRHRGRHTLKNLFQEWGVPPWQRNRIPLIYIDNQVIGAVGYFIDPAFAAKAGEQGYDFEWQPMSCSKA